MAAQGALIPYVEPLEYQRHRGYERATQILAPQEKDEEDIDA
jgi:hypothetical protein